MTEEIKDLGVPMPEGTPMPGVDVATGKPTGSVNNPGAQEAPVQPEAASVQPEPKQTVEQPQPNEEVAGEAPVIDPMKPVGPN